MKNVTYVKKSIAVLLLFILLACTLPISSHADGDIYARLKCTTSVVYPGGSLTIAVLADGENIAFVQSKLIAEEEGNPFTDEGRRLIEYDESKLKLIGTPTSDVEGWEYSVGPASFLIGNDRSSTAVSGMGLALVKFRFEVKSDVKVGETLNFRLPSVLISNDVGKGFSGTLQCSATVAERPKNENTNLMVLRCEEGTLTPEFKPSIEEYSLTVGHEVSSIQVIAVAAGEGATFSVSGNEKLSYGVNTVLVVVKSESGAEKTYTISVNRQYPPSDNCKLSSLTVKDFALSPAFDPSVYEYSLSVPAEVRTLSIDAAASEEHAAVSISGNSGFKEGLNTVTIKVTAENGTDIANYILRVQRDRSIEEESTLTSLTFGGYPISPVFDGNITDVNYTVKVPYTVDSFSMLKAVMRGKYSTIDIQKPDKPSVGENEILITVTSEGGSKKNEYRLVVIRDKNDDATLKSLTANKGELSPAFSPDVYAYALVTDPNPGMISFEAVPNDSKAYAEQLAFRPTEGASVQTIRCTAQNGKEQVYTVVVVTPAAPDKYLLISGTPSSGQKLTAVLSGMDEGGTYYWYLDGAVAAGKNGSVYIVSSDDEGKTLRVVYSTGEETISSQTILIGSKQGGTTPGTNPGTDPGTTPDPGTNPGTDPGTTPDNPSTDPANPSGKGGSQNGSSNTANNDGSSDEEAAGKGADVVVVIILALVCLGLGCGIGFFFTKRKFAKKDRS